MCKLFDKKWYFIFTMKALIEKAWKTLEFMPAIDFAGKCEEYGFTLNQGSHIYDLCYLLVAGKQEITDPEILQEIMNDHMMDRVNAE